MDKTEAMQIREFARDMDKPQKAIYYEQKKKNSGLAAVASFLIPGLGQIYLGKIGKGIVILLLCWLIIPWLYGIYDAYKSANNYNSELYMIIFSPSGSTEASFSFRST
jgi:TM2 domain-containing membrane protein YozV